MTGLLVLHKYIGPAFWGLIPMSVLTVVLVMYVFYSILRGREINQWAEVLLAHSKEVSQVIGLTGSVYALTQSFRVDYASVEEIRKGLFFILSNGFWSTIAGVAVSLQATIGLIAMKRT